MTQSQSLRFCSHCGAPNRLLSKYCSRCGNLLEEPLPDPLTGQAGALKAQSLLLQRYRIVTQLGQGGFGTIYKAQDTRFNNALRAVKEMSAQSLDPAERQQAIAAFKHEAHLLAGLMHPNLPRIYDHFEERGRWYLVMDYIEGETLEERLTNMSGGKMTVPQVLPIALQLCTVLHYLHMRQPPIIFRDLKPANVMLSADDHLYLIDFGIARLFKSGQAKDTVALGSPGYAAPEQYGKAQTTEQADIYSLGATLHHLLSGRDPSDEPFQFPPLKLDQYAPAGPTLATLVRQMVETDKSKRPRSVQEVKQRLQDLQQQPAPGQQKTGTAFPVNKGQNESQKPAIAKTIALPPPPPLPGTQTLAYIHHPGVYTVAWSPDGTRIASGGADGLVRVWGAGGNSLATYRDHPSFVYQVAWSPDGTRIASVSRGVVKISDVYNGGKLLLSYNDPAVSQDHQYASVMTWSPDGNRIASASCNATVIIWNARTGGKPLLVYTGHSTIVHALAWSPDGTRIASVDYTGMVQVWDANRGGKPLLTYTYEYTDHGHHDDLILAVTWSPDSTRIACGGYGKIVRISDACKSGALLLQGIGHKDTISAVAWSPDGARIASASHDRTVQIWDAHEKKKPLLIYTCQGVGVRTVAWSPDGTRLASDDGNDVMRVWG